MRAAIALASVAVWLAPPDVNAATLMVGPAQPFATIAAAVSASADGDTIAVQAGTYTNDFSEIRTKITLTAVGGRVVMKATEALPNEKGILVTDTDVTVNGFTFTGARIANRLGGNGAGLRYQGGKLVLHECYFHNNQDGLLAGADAAGSITITRSEFAYNGDKTGPNAGYTHNIYIGAVARADIESSYFHNANAGHEIKSRALVTVINDTRITDGPTGTASYSIDLPNGGVASITNDQIGQGPDSENPVIMSFGEETPVYAGSSVAVSQTLIENDLTAHGPVGLNNPASQSAALTGVSVYGLTPAELVSGPATQSGTVFLATEPAISTKHPW